MALQCDVCQKKMRKDHWEFALNSKLVRCWDLAAWFYQLVAVVIVAWCAFSCCFIASVAHIAAEEDYTCLNHSIVCKKTEVRPCFPVFGSFSPLSLVFKFVHVFLRDACPLCLLLVHNHRRFLQFVWDDAIWGLCRCNFF